MPVAGLAVFRQCAASAASLAHCRALPLPLQHLQSLLIPPPSPPAQAPGRGYAAAAAQALESEPEPPSTPERQLPPKQGMQPFTLLRFDDPATAFRTKTSGELALAYATFTACQVCHHAAPASRIPGEDTGSQAESSLLPCHVFASLVMKSLKPGVRSSSAVPDQ